MLHPLRRLIITAFSAAILSTLGAAERAQAQTYPIDCAILLCLAGGWPTSAPCAHARAVFIQRITPWPVEPPLQIWRCPMGAWADVPGMFSPIERLYDISDRGAKMTSVPHSPTFLMPVKSSEEADIDISASAFDFVRSIRVYHIVFTQWKIPDGGCERFDSTRLGFYGPQGAYRWVPSSVAEIPEASALPTTGQCNRVDYRAVFVDWRDFAGNYGFDEVRY